MENHIPKPKFLVEHVVQLVSSMSSYSETKKTTLRSGYHPAVI